MMQTAKPRFSNFFLLYKMGPKLFSVLGKILKSAKAVKLGLAGASMATYSVIFSWKFALILMFMLFVHESGHIWAMKQYGIKTKGIYFLPFVGGAAVAEDAFPSRKAEMVTAIMGPVWGFGLAFVTAVCYMVTGNVLFAAASSWMAMINLFNLLPINPLDGGRIMKSIVFSISSGLGIVFMFIGLLITAFLALAGGYTIFLFLLVIGLIELQAEYSNRKKLRQQVEESKALAEKQYVINLAKAGDKTGSASDKDEETEYRELPVMGRLAVLGSAFAYFMITVVLWLNMELMSHIPGAAMALEILKG
jgi:Zn-dependent protease